MLRRLSKMNAREIGWRGKASARIAWDRIRAAHAAPAWHRGALAVTLAADPSLGEVGAALGRREWMTAHRRLAAHFTARTQDERFPLAPPNRAALVAAVLDRFPGAPAAAKTRADRILDGRYDLLGYRGLSFRDPRGTVEAVDWQRDPVHDRVPPRRFWSQVPYLDPDCGDHKIIWELNRHQHWLALGRAYWLTGDDRYRKRFVEELSSWLEANPPLIGINWASMLELGLRSISWLWMLAFFAEGAAQDDTPWLVDLLLALDRQLTQIERNLSYYFSPNTHLLGEALALYVAGRCLPELAANSAREALGRQVLVEEIGRQIAPDGGHCELSTHYQRYTLDFYVLALLVARATNDAAAAEFERAVVRLASATRVLADDRGCLPHIGDDDGGATFPIAGRSPDDVCDSLAAAAVLVGRSDLQIGLAPEETYWLLGDPEVAGRFDHPAVRRHPCGSSALANTGYYVSRSSRGDHLVIDGGAHGYLNGGHAHADALSLSLTAAGVPLLVDPGTGSYTTDRVLRDRLRSSEMHNTLVIDGRSQSIASGPFSWKHKANGRARLWRTHQTFDYFEGEHDGYRPLDHRRHVLALHDDLLIVADLVRGPGTHTAAVHWHVDPRWTVRAGGNMATLAAGSACYQLVVPMGHIERFVADRHTGLGWHAPVYGSVQPLTSLRVTRRGAWPLWIVSVFGLDSANPVSDARFVPVAAAARALEHAVAVRISRRASTDFVAISEAAPGEQGDAAPWRFDTFETDARALFCRVVDERLTRVALVDGSVVRRPCEGAAGVQMPHRLPAMRVDLQCPRAPEAPIASGAHAAQEA